MKPFAVAVFCLLVLAGAPAFAGLTMLSGTASFANPQYERFNETVDYTNAVNHPDSAYSASMVVIGSSRPYVFSNTGIELVAPIPNVYGNWLPIISVIKGNQYYNFGVYGELMPFTNTIPGGTGAKFLLETGSSSVHFSPYVLNFPGNGASKVGGNWIMAGQTPGTDKIVVTAYSGPNASGTLLGTAIIPAVTVSQWASTFYGFKASDDSIIKSIGIDYSTNNNAGYPGVANLVFDPAGNEIPEPATIGMLGIAVLCFGLFLYRKRK